MKYTTNDGPIKFMDTQIQQKQKYLQKASWECFVKNKLQANLYWFQAELGIRFQKLTVCTALLYTIFLPSIDYSLQRK